MVLFACPLACLPAGLLLWLPACLRTSGSDRRRYRPADLGRDLVVEPRWFLFFLPQDSNGNEQR